MKFTLQTTFANKNDFIHFLLKDKIVYIKQDEVM